MCLWKFTCMVVPGLKKNFWFPLLVIRPWLFERVKNPKDLITLCVLCGVNRENNFSPFFPHFSHHITSEMEVCVHFWVSVQLFLNTQTFALFFRVLNLSDQVQCFSFPSKTSSIHGLAVTSVKLSDLALLFEIYQKPFTALSLTRLRKKKIRANVSKTYGQKRLWRRENGEEMVSSDYI